MVRPARIVLAITCAAAAASSLAARALDAQGTTTLKQGFGRFLTEVDLERIKDRDFVLTMATRFPGLYTVTDAMGRRSLANGRSVQGLTGGPPCLVTVFLDDVELPKEDADVIRIWDLAVVEFHTGTQVPVRYRPKSPCGVLLLWSKWY